MGAGSSTLEQTSWPVENGEPVQAADQGEATLASFVNQEEEMAEAGTQLGEEEGPKDGPRGNLDRAQGCELEGEQQGERSKQLSEPGVPEQAPEAGDQAQQQEDQQEEEQEKDGKEVTGE